MKLHLKLIILALLPVVFACNPDNPGKANSKYAGLVINEIAAHDETGENDSWVEIINTSERTMSLEGLFLFISDNYFTNQQFATLGGSLGPGERKIVSTADGSMITGIASNAPFTLVLGEDSQHVVDSYEHKAEDRHLGYFASWQRIPDGNGDWKWLPYSSPGRANEIFDYTKTRPTAIWAWGAHLADLANDNGAELRRLKDLGYDHILLNFAGFDNKGYRKNLVKCMNVANEIGLHFHVWIQCFYNGDWVSPIDDASKSFDEKIYEKVRNEVHLYIEEFGVKGVHLDYIRFAGTAAKHYHNNDINGITAVNRCCREVREITDSYDAGIVTSAALMPEPNSTQSYGQAPYQMAEFIHILMPMIYRYGSYNFSDDTFKSRSDYFADQAAKKGGVSWSGIQTYNAANKGMTAEELRRDIDLMAATKASGIVLFRYQLGSYPDINDLWK